MRAMRRAVGTERRGGRRQRSSWECFAGRVLEAIDTRKSRSQGLAAEVGGGKTGTRREWDGRGRYRRHLAVAAALGALGSQRRQEGAMKHFGGGQFVAGWLLPVLLCSCCIRAGPLAPSKPPSQPLSFLSSSRLFPVPGIQVATTSDTGGPWGRSSTGDCPVAHLAILRQSRRAPLTRPLLKSLQVTMIECWTCSRAYEEA